MGILDKAKFWKKNNDDDFGSFDTSSFDSEPSTPGASPTHDSLGGLDSGMGNDLDSGIPSLDTPSTSGANSAEGMHDPMAMNSSLDMNDSIDSYKEVVQPSAATARVSAGLNPGSQTPNSAPQQPQFPPQQAPPQPSQTPQHHPYQNQPQFAHQQQFSDRSRDMELIHAKLDSIKSSLDAINQRLISLERYAGNNNNQNNKYNW